MEIRVNDAVFEVDDDATVRDALAAAGLDPDASGIAVAVGMRVVPRSAWSTTTLADGARLDVVTATQGG